MKAISLIPNGRYIFKAKNAKEIVLQMSRLDFLCHGKSDYMAEVKLRLKNVYLVDMDFAKGDFDKFLKELERHEFIKIEGTN